MNKTPTWRKSTYSGGEAGQCVELAALNRSVGLRDSKNPSVGHLTLNHLGASGLLEAVKAGELDL